MLSISVEGEGELRKYYVHQDILYDQSLYFSALSNFKEGEEAHVTLIDMNQKAFANIIHWVYKGVLDPELSRTPEDLIRTWTAADYLMMNKCKNKVMDALRHLSAQMRIKPKDLILVDKLGHRMDSNLANCVIDVMARDCAIEYGFLFSTADLEPMPIHVVCELINAITTAARFWADDPAKLEECAYHDHEDGEVCYLEEYESMCRECEEREACHWVRSRG